jgi:two-component system, chemotaxis family, sensor kinase CheA
MATDDSTELTPELLNDFYAECEEHLGGIRQSLVALENGLDQEEAASQIEKLFRDFHSIKGMAGIAGIRPAEELSHRAEDYLRELLRGNAQLTPPGLDLLAGSVQALDNIVAAYRQKQPFPDIKPLLGQFGALLSTKSPAFRETPAPEVPAADPLQLKTEKATSRGLSVWKATFVPSAALNQRGVNVNAIRGRLSALGEIIHAAPQIGARTIAFEFFVALNEPPPDLPAWERDGVRFERVAEPSRVAAQSASETPAPSQLAGVAPSQVIRVELQRMDDLMRIAGELVIQRARLEEQIHQLAALEHVDLRGLQEVNLGFARHSRDLRDTVMRLRMVPIAEIFDRMPFVVRDLTRGSGKKVRIDLRGQLTELDKYVVERLKDPLLHLVRNALSHGIEEAQERVAKGKPAEGTLTLSASAAGETVVIEVADDGRGIDSARIARKAREMEISTPETLDEAATLELISIPGFSTREEADRAAGRGVGMAVVANTIRELGGSLFLDTEVNRGARFTFRLPLTLLITEALIVAAGDQRFAILQNGVEQVIQADESQVKRMERAEFLAVSGTALPLLRLRSMLGFPPGTNPHPPVLVSQTDRGRVGVVVDRILGQRQIVVRSIRDPLIHVPGVIGATELGDGRPLLILDAAGLAKKNGAGRPGQLRFSTESNGVKRKEP